MQIFTQIIYYHFQIILFYYNKTTHPFKMLKQTSIAIFFFFTIATILSYVSIFLPYYDKVNFDNCLNSGTVTPCKIGAGLHITSLILATIVMGIFFSYIILHFTKMNTNKIFTRFNIPIIVAMVLVFIMSIASSVLINDTVNLNNNVNQLEGFYTLISSTCLYFICMLLLIVYFWVLKN